MRKPTFPIVTDSMSLLSFLSELVDNINDIESVIAPLKEKRDKARAVIKTKERNKAKAKAEVDAKAEAKSQALAAAKSLVARVEAEAEAKIAAEAKTKEETAAIIAARKLIKENK